MLRRRALSALLSGSCAIVTLFGARLAGAGETLTFDGTVTEGGLEHEFIDFEVPAGTQEIQIDHDDLSNEDILDWGLNDPDGFRGWGGGNSEPAVVAEKAASRSYLAGPIKPGTWRVVIGKAKLVDGSADYHVVVTLRDAPTLAAQPERKPYVAAAALAKGPRYYAGDLHAHSRESGDADPTIADLSAFARAQGLDFVEMSEHNTVSQLDFLQTVQAEHPDLLLVPGVELTTYAGHANGIGATAWVDHKMGQPGVDIAGAAAAFREQGALFSINHPLLDLGDLCIGCGWKHELSAEAIDAVEIATAGSAALLADGTLAFWDELCDTGRHVAPVGGSDDHGAGQKEGAFSTPLGTPTTYVYAEELSVASLLLGIKNSRTVVKIGGVTDPMVELTSEIAPEGDTVHAERTRLHAKITGADGLGVRWVRNGEMLDGGDVTGDAFELEMLATAPASGQDRYRVEVLRNGRPATITGHLWVEFKAGVSVKDDVPGDGGGCSCRVGPVDEGAMENIWGGGAGSSWGVVVAALGGLGLALRRRRVIAGRGWVIAGRGGRPRRGPF